MPIPLERIHLAIIREVDRQGSLTAAAATLHLTQSALSHAMRKLELSQGVALWHRDGRRLRLTQSGRFLLATANRILPQLEEAEARLQQYASGERGTLRIGMECHPCYQWLLRVVEPYLTRWPDVDVDVRQKFKFGGLGALLDHEIDLLVTPDPLLRPGLRYTPVFDYEQVLAVARDHPLAGQASLEPQQLADQVLLTYPVEPGRLDVFNLFLTPAGIAPKRHKVLESTDIILQMVACGRGVTALPGWLVREYADRFDIVPVRLGKHGIGKTIHLGTRDDDDAQYLQGFIDLAYRVGHGV